jgi:hypothetical protein
MKDKERRERLVQLWLQRPLDKCAENDVLKFYGEIKLICPELLKRGHGDPYEQLKVDLRGYVTF